MAIRIPPTDVQSFDSLDEFLGSPTVPQGAFSVYLNGVPVDLLYEDRGFGTTAVLFHAALGLTIKELPVFLGRKFSELVPVNRLFVSDPTLNIHENLTLAWYAGSSVHPNLQDHLAKIFQKVTAGNRAIYFGASGGGFASLFYSASHPGSLAMPVNPQTNIRSYTTRFVCRWTNTAWGLENQDDGSDLCMPPTTTNLRELYASPVQNHVIYVQNTGDRTHMPGQWKPFEESIHPSNSLKPLLVFSGNGHIAPPPDYLAAVMSIIASADSWDHLDFATIEVPPISKKRQPEKLTN